MAELVTPTVRVRASFLDAMGEFRTEGRGGAQDASMVGDELRWFGSTPSTTGQDFTHFLEWLVGQSLEDAPRPPGYVPATTLW